MLMFQAITLLFSWLPPPLDVLAAGALTMVLIVAIIRLIAFIWELLPFN